MIVPKPPTSTPNSKAFGSEVKDDNITVAGTFEIICDKVSETKYS